MQVHVRTTQNVLIHYPIASLGDRILAYLLDALIKIVYVVLMFVLLIRLDVQVVWIWIVTLGIPLLLFSLMFEIFMNGQTPGKRVMHIQVIRLNGTPATIGDFIIRWLFAFVDIQIMSGLVAVILISVGGKGQRLGDMVAGTTVIKQVEEAEVAASELFVTTDDSYTVTYPQASLLNERDVELIQQALAVNRETGNMQPVMMVVEKVKSLLGVQTDLPPLKFLYTVLKDFHHLTAQQ